jgi:hypothetical protein
MTTEAKAECALKASGGLNVFGNGATAEVTASVAKSAEFSGETTFSWDWDIQQLCWTKLKYNWKTYQATAIATGKSRNDTNLVAQDIQSQITRYGWYELDCTDPLTIGPTVGKNGTVTVRVPVWGSGTIKNVTKGKDNGTQTTYTFQFNQIDRKPVDETEGSASVFQVLQKDHTVKMNNDYLTGKQAALFLIGKAARTLAITFFL